MAFSHYHLLKAWNVPQLVQIIFYIINFRIFPYISGVFLAKVGSEYIVDFMDFLKSILLLNMVITGIERDTIDFMFMLYLTAVLKTITSPHNLLIMVHFYCSFRYITT